MGQHDYQIALAQLLQIGGEQQLRIKKGHDVKAEAVELGREIAGNGARQAAAERSDVLGINDAVDRTLEHFIRDRMAQPFERMHVDVESQRERRTDCRRPRLASLLVLLR